ncbi:MAG: branched-chain amino acid ABC transporter permease [Deltaproteobacteria bacterium]|jgi:branched-chain amino acid transport system permease protein
MTFLTDLFTPLVMGVLIGGLYALIAQGLSLVFGVMRLINVAHGDLVVFGTYFAYACLTMLGIDPILSLVFGMPIMFAVGFAVQKFLMSRSFGISMEAPLIIAFGLSLVLQNTDQIIWTPLSRGLNMPYCMYCFTVGEIYIPFAYFLDLVAALVVMVILSLFLKKTYLGRAINAASQNKKGALLMGIDTNRVYAVTFGIATATAAVAGVFLGLTFPFSPTTGISFLIISFGVIVVGGMGSMLGTFIGGIILGLSQTLGGHFFSDAAQMLVAYLVVLIALSIKPQGLFGR